MTVFFKNFADPKVVNENQEEVAQFKKNATLPTREKYDMFDNADQSIEKVEKIRNNFGFVDLPRIVIKTASHKIELIKEFSIKGEWNASEFTILKNP